MSDLDALLGAPLGELPAVITVDVYALALAEIRTARAEIERLDAELASARERHRILWGLERDWCVKLRRERDEARAGQENR